MTRVLIAATLPAIAIVAVAALFLVAWPVRVQAAECGSASWYGNEHHGRRTASGAVFNQWAMTAASNSLPLGTRAIVRNVQNGKSVRIVVTDTGGFGKYGRIIDLSRGAFAKLANTDKGIIRVCVSRL